MRNRIVSGALALFVVCLPRLASGTSITWEFTGTMTYAESFQAGCPSCPNLFSPLGSPVISDITFDPSEAQHCAIPGVAQFSNAQTTLLLNGHFSGATALLLDLNDII